MKISVKVKLRAQENRVEQIDGDHFQVFVKALPIDGRANEAVIRTLAEYFHVAPSDVEIASGFTSKTKIVNINVI